MHDSHVYVQVLIDLPTEGGGHGTADNAILTEAAERLREKYPEVRSASLSIDAKIICMRPSDPILRRYPMDVP